MADIIIEKLFGKELFSSDNLSKDGDTRKAYLKAVKQADDNKYQPLLDVANS